MAGSMHSAMPDAPPDPVAEGSARAATDLPGRFPLPTLPTLQQREPAVTRPGDDADTLGSPASPDATASGTGSGPKVIGREMARYRILDEVGRGGMAVVYRGLDTTLGREVAVKVLHQHLSSQPEARARLQREAQAVAKLHHENILEIFDYSGADSADSFIVTEFIHGRTLTAFLDATRVPLSEVAVMIAAEIAGALEHAHRFGVIHRDVKPENVMIRDDGRVKLTDFGIAQIVDTERLTATGQLIGSPAYMAPELVEGGRVDFRTDVFALGILTYRLATGTLPFAGKNPHEVMKKIADARFVPADQVTPLVGTSLSRILGKALAKLPAGRFQDMAAMHKELVAELETAGISDGRAELARFFADPAAWEAEARPRIVAALVARARQEAGRGRSAVALALTNRALAITPGDRGARGLLDGMARRDRLRKVAVVLSATLLAGGGAMVVAEHGLAGWRDRGKATSGAAEGAGGTDPGATMSAASSDPDGRGSAGDNAQSSTANHRVPFPPPSHASPRPRDLHPRVAPRALEAPRPAARLLAVNVTPKRADFLLDDKAMGEWIPGRPIEVPPGQHVVEFRNPACYPRRVVIGASDSNIGEVRLDWRPAILTVSTSPVGASIVIRPEGGNPTPVSDRFDLQIPIPPRSPNGRQRVHVTVSNEGYKAQQFDWEVVASVHRHEPVRLERNP